MGKFRSGRAGPAEVGSWCIVQSKKIVTENIEWTELTSLSHKRHS